MDELIDAVVTWVDGNDPVHKAKKGKYLHRNYPGIMNYATLEGRFIETGELKYCIFSLRKFASWIRNIYLVTDEQCPDWLSTELQYELDVQIIDHKEIFRDHIESLPTFNNISIMSLIWKIPGIANKYILFNDDNFIIARIKPEDFFIGDKLVFRGKWYPQYPGLIIKWKRIVKYIIRNKKLWNLKSININPEINGAKITGNYNQYFNFAHAPLPLRRDIQEAFYFKYPELLSENVKYKFRNNKQFGPGIIVVHLTSQCGNAIVIEGDDSEMIMPRKGGLMDNKGKFQNLNSDKIRFLCFQDLFFLKEENPSEFMEVKEYLDKLILSGFHGQGSF